MLTFRDFVNASILAKNMISEGRKPKEPKEESSGSLKDDLMHERIWTVGASSTARKRNTGRIYVADFQFDKLEKYIQDNFKEEFDKACNADGIKSFDEAVNQKHLPVNVNNFFVKLQKRMNEANIKKSGSAKEKEISDILDNIVLGNASSLMNTEEYRYNTTHFNNTDPVSVTERKFHGLSRAIDTYDETKGASALTHIKNSVNGHILNTRRSDDEGISNSQSLDDTASPNNTTHVDKDMKISELIPDNYSDIFRNSSREEKIANVHQALETLPDEEQELIDMYVFDDMTFDEMRDEFISRGEKITTPTVRSHVYKAIEDFGVRFKDLFSDKYNEAI